MRLALVTLWILAGSTINGVLYWTFLNTPESTVWTLAASALLGLAMMLIDGFTVTGAIAILATGVSRPGMARAARATPSIIPASLLVLAAWWLTISAEAWVTLRAGQIAAWFIAQFGWSDMSRLFDGIHYIAMWLRWVVALLLAVSLMSGFMAIGARALSQAAWLRRALRPRALVVATAAFVVLVALPWNYFVPWRPASLPATAVEVVFIVTKLSVAAVMFAVAAALIIREASGAVPPPVDPVEAGQAA